jgi:hypothetical protein
MPARGGLAVAALGEQVGQVAAERPAHELVIGRLVPGTDARRQRADAAAAEGEVGGRHALEVQLVGRVHGLVHVGEAEHLLGVVGSRRLRLPRRVRHSALLGGGDSGPSPAISGLTSPMLPRNPPSSWNGWCVGWPR